jgi:hypothetical protein
VSVTTARRVMEDAGYRPPKVKREPQLAGFIGPERLQIRFTPT